MKRSCPDATSASGRGHASAAVWLASACFVWSGPARADDAAAADALFRAGKELAAKGAYQQACPKFEASYKLDATLGTLLNVADCHEKVQLLWQCIGQSCGQELVACGMDPNCACYAKCLATNGFDLAACEAQCGPQSATTTAVATCVFTQCTAACGGGAGSGGGGD